MMRFRVLAIFMLIVGTMSGCRKYDGVIIRKDHAKSFPQELAEKSSLLLANYSELNLNDCINLAMDHSLEIRCADIQQKISKLNKKTSFSNFMPAVSLNVQQLSFDPNPQINLLGGVGVEMHDKEFREVTWNIQWSLFNPATWNLYAMHARGYDIATLVNQYTRQGIALQVTSLYFQALSLEGMVEVAQHFLEAAEALETELKAKYSQGLISVWQQDQARVQVLSRDTQWHQYQRTLNQVRAELLVTMGLSPQSTFRLKSDLPLTVPVSSLEDALAEALLSHPSLAMADLRIAMDKEKVKLAFASFLPQLTGMAQRFDTNDSHQVFSNYWLGGITGTMSVFTGFANIHQYQAAKQQQEDTFIQREQATLALMIQVIRAWDQVETAREQVSLAQLASHVADQQLNELNKKRAQGLVSASELAGQLAIQYQSHAQHLLAQLQDQTSVAMLLNVMGQTQIDFEE